MSKSALSVLVATLMTCSLAMAQNTSAPPPVYSGSFGGGLALTGGNTETKNFNLAFNLVRDPKTNNLFKADALYLRGTQNDVLSLDRASIKLRDEYTISNRTFVFAEMGYLRDRFKDIRYLMAPVGGVGYKVVNNDSTVLSFSGGAGGFWEKNSGVPVKKSGNVNAGQNFSQKISSTATITESIATLWKTNDFEDSLTNFAVGVTTSLASKLELKVELQDNYKNKPPNATIKKNDTAFITTFLLKY